MDLAADESTAVAAAIGGDRPALEQLLLAQYPRLQRRLRLRIPVDLSGVLGVDDVLQDAFVDVFRGIGSFRNGGDGSFESWLNAIVEHRLQDSVRRLRRIKRGGGRRPVGRRSSDDESIVELVALLSDHGHSPSQCLARDEAIRAVRLGLAGLPDDQRAAIFHRYVEQQSVEATAEVMRCSPGAVRGLLHRGKHALREALGRSTRWFAHK